MIYGVVYVITNLITGMKYVGQTTQSLELRFKAHLYEETYIGNSMRKYGIKNFTIEIIEECESRKQLNEREIFWIANLNTKRPKGYNLTNGGEGIVGCLRTPEHCLIISSCRKNPSPYPTLSAELESRKITYGKMAKKLGWHTSKLARKMRGERNFSLSQMIEIKKILGVDNMSVEELFSRTDGKPLLPCPYLYPILYRELQLQNITLAKIGEVLGLSRITVPLKMHGKFRFSVDEAEKVKDFLKIDMSIEELFSLADGSAPDLATAKSPSPCIYPVLEEELKRQGISMRKLSENLGWNSSAMSLKISGKIGIKPEQKAAVKEFLKVEMSVEELFKRRE